MSMVFDAIAKIGAKGVVCLNRSETGTLPVPKHIYLADQIPHSWLLPRVKGFVHHGGAGHTAVGAKFGIPMLAIPFFLDQNFWAAKIQELQLGPSALAYRTLTIQKLALSLSDLLSHKYQHRCTEMATQICLQQDGAEVAANSVARLQSSIKEDALCDILPGLKASWKHSDSGLRLSGAAAACLTSHSILSWSDLDSDTGLDWSKQRYAASTRLINILDKVTGMLYCLMSLIYSILKWIMAPWVKPELQDDYTIKMRDPVRQARMRQGEYDLRFIVQRTTETKDSASIEDRVIRNWQILSTARFHEKFTDKPEHEEKSGV